MHIKNHLYFKAQIKKLSEKLETNCKGPNKNSEGKTLS